MKINTGLPYDVSKMNDIEKNGATVDMSDIKYPTISEKDFIRVSYIYLRNTAYNDIDLDFSKTTYEFKKDFLLFYLFGDIEYVLKEITSTWIKILGKYIGQEFQIDSILSDDEIKQFIDEECDKLQNVMTFIMSLPLYPIIRMNTDDEVDYSDIEETDEKPINDDVIDLIKHPYFNDLYLNELDIKPKIYKKIFTENNNKLFETLMIYTSFSTILVGMNDREKWSEFVDNISKCFGENDHYEIIE